MGNYYCGSGHSRSQECVHCVGIRRNAENAKVQFIIDREQERIIKLLRHEYLEMDNLEYEHFSDTCITCDNIELIKGKK